LNDKLFDFPLIFGPVNALPAVPVPTPLCHGVL